MTIRAHIDELARVLEGHQADEQEALAVGRLMNFASKLQTEARRLDGLAEAAEELRSADMGFPSVDQVEELIEVAETSLETADDDALAVGQGDVPPVVEVARGVAEAATARIDSAWSVLKREHAPPAIDEELLDLAAQGDPELAARFESAETRLFTLREKTRPSEGDITTWLQYVGELRDVAAAVADQAPSQEVIEFVRDASSRHGASIDHLESPDVQAWLAEGDRKNRYRITTRPARA